MIASIQFKDESTGKWVNPGTPLDKAFACFLAMGDDASGSWGDYGFGWIVHCLSRYCLHRAKEDSNSHEAADRWIERYKALRGIK